MDTEERLEKLERELFAEKRRNRWLLVAVGLGVVGVALAWTLANTTATAQAQGPNIAPKVIRANQFILEDENGNPRAVLKTEKDGPRLALFDENGKFRVALTANKDTSALALADENGKFRAGLRVDKKDGPELALFDENGKFRVTLGANKDGPRLALLDENGKPRAALTANKDTSALALWDETGKVIWSQP
jgi:hypothetical protein